MHTTVANWPTPKYIPNYEPHFLFILTPPFSGSTALAELINSSHKTMILRNKAEGQWLISGLCDSERWNPEKEINYQSIKAVWLQKYQTVHRLVQNIEVVIEKSPPNMVRIEALAVQFKSYSILANNRNPYAQCASHLYRNNKDAQNLSASTRLEILASVANDWVVRSYTIQKLVQKLQLPLLTYEEFCQNLAAIIEILSQFPDLKIMAASINPNAKVKVKDYQPQAIVNQNARQLVNLNASEIQCLTSVFEQHEALLDFYAYKLTVA